MPHPRAASRSVSPRTSMPTSERRKERARLAQRKSRAQRREQYEKSQAKVQALAEALDDITETCLRFNDVVVSAIKEDDPRRLKQSLKPFLAKVLSANKYAITEDDEEPNDDLLEAKYSPMQQSNLATWALVAKPGHSMLPDAPIPPLSPRLTYGLWPSQKYGAPLDVVAYLDSDNVRRSSFATVLYWNTLLYGYSALERPMSFQYLELFHYALQFATREQLKVHLRRRLRYRPKSIGVYVPTLEIDMAVKNSEEAALEAQDVAVEATHAQDDTDRIVQAVTSEHGNSAIYLGVEGVESRLQSVWNVDTTALSGTNVIGTSGMLRMSNASTRLLQIINRIVLQGRCLGKHVGFPIHVVDAAAAQALLGPSPPLQTAF